MAKTKAIATKEQLRIEVDELRLRLTEAEETLSAIRKGEVDALFVDGVNGEQIFSLTSAETPYRIIIEAMNEGAATLMDDGTILFCNKRFLEFTARAYDKLIGTNFLQLFPADEQLNLTNLLKTGIINNCSEVVRYSTQSTDFGYFHLVFSPLPSSFVGDVCVLVSDITDLKNKEAELQRASDLLEQRVAERTAELAEEIAHRKTAEQQIKLKNNELVKLNADKDKFFSIIAHDLRNPFNSFLGLTQILAVELPTLTREQILKIAVNLRKSASNLFALLENLLEWSRLQQGLMTFHPVAMSLKMKISESLQSLQESVDNKEMIISYEIPEDLHIYADENMFNVIIRNLVTNAIKFTPRGGKISIAAKGISKHFAVISVLDTGIGINNENIADLFSLEQNANRKGTENEPSTGLGLIICKDFIGKHGGELWVESEEGKGSKFYSTLPLPASAGTAAAKAAPAEAAKSTTTATAKSAAPGKIIP
jgi:PAS domain S-box-containing protein